MDDRTITYTYPRSLAESSRRHLCNGEDAKAIHGPYKGEYDMDMIVLYLTIAALCAVLGLMYFGVIQ